MEALGLAEHELGTIWRFVWQNLSVRTSDRHDHEQHQHEQQHLTFSIDEEKALEEKINDGIAAYRRALVDAQDSIQELNEPQKNVIEAAQTLEMHRKQLQIHVVECRKVLVAYRQRAKLERLAQQRKSLLLPSAKAIMTKSSNTTSIGLVTDVTAALKRTRQVMSQEIERVSSVTKVLDNGRLSLKSCHDEYTNVNAELAEVQKRLKVLEWQAKQDKVWIGAGIALLVSTVLFIVYERTGYVVF